MFNFEGRAGWQRNNAVKHKYTWSKQYARGAREEIDRAGTGKANKKDKFGASDFA